MNTYDNEFSTLENLVKKLTRELINFKLRVHNFISTSVRKDIFKVLDYSVEQVLKQAQNQEYLDQYRDYNKLYRDFVDETGNSWSGQVDLQDLEDCEICQTAWMHADIDELSIECYTPEELRYLYELKECAFNVIKLHPGIDCNKWIDELIRHYTVQVIDMYGGNPGLIYNELTVLWEKEYLDETTGMMNTFSGWSKQLFNDPEVIREKLNNAEEKIRDLQNELTLLKTYYRKINKLSAT